MIDLSTIKPTFKAEPMRILLHGPLKIGKTTLAAQAPGALFMPIENGLSGITAASLPVVNHFSDVIIGIKALLDQPHDFQTFVVDSLDWLERIVWKQTCIDHNEESIESFGYGKGYTEALTTWEIFRAGLDKLHQRGMTIILISHSEPRRYDNPETDAYDRITIKLHKHASALLCEWSDVILFANHKVLTTSEDAGFNKKRTRALNTSERVLYTEERPAFVAGNRYGFPTELEMSWSAIESAYQDSMNRLSQPAPKRKSNKTQPVTETE